MIVAPGAVAVTPARGCYPGLRVLYSPPVSHYVADGHLFSLSPRILELGYSYLSSLEFWDFGAG